jgi:isopenicillin N synthase-like dioxygenase
MDSTKEEAEIRRGCFVPSIRLDDDEDPVPALRKACVEIGFFYLEGHGLGTEELKRVFEESRKLFELPLEEKRRLSDHVLSRGYTAMQEETLDPAVQTEGDTKEGYYIGREIPEDDPRYDPKKLRGPNQWPSKDVLVLPDFQSVMATDLS